MQVRKTLLLMFIVLSSRISDINSFWFIGDDEDYSSSGNLEVVDANNTSAENDTTDGNNNDVVLIDIGSTSAENDTKQHENKAIDAIDIISTSAEHDTSHPAIGGIDAIVKVNISERKGIVLDKDENIVYTENGVKDISIIKKEDTERIIKNDKRKDSSISRKVTTDRNNYSNIGNVIKPFKPDDRAKEECIEESIEVREKRASVIITAKVLNLMNDPNDNDLSIAKVQIKRVFKGSDIIHAVVDERPNMMSEDSYNKVISIHGIGEGSICESYVNIGDTRIFMLKLEYFGNLRINSSVIRISAYTLDRTNAAVKVEPLSDGCELYGRCFRSFKKNEEPHTVKVFIEVVNRQPTVTRSNCTCTIGLSGACGHITGVLYQFAKYKLQGLKAIPEDIAKTSQPQTWHIPRGISIPGKAVQDLQVFGHSKTKVPDLEEVPRTIKSTLYNPVRGQPINWHEKCTKLSSVSPDLLVIPAIQEVNIRYVASKFGLVPRGSILSYQQRLEDNCILNVYDGIGFQELPAANVMMNNFHFVLTSEQLVKFEGLKVCKKEIQRFEENTRLQSQTSMWYSIRRYRITASNISEIFKRRKEEGPLVQRLKSTRHVMTTAMRQGLALEPVAAKVAEQSQSLSVWCDC